MIAERLRELAAAGRCELADPAGRPPAERLPADVIAFYEACGGAWFPGAQIGIVAPSQFRPASLAILGEQYDDDPSSQWWIVAESDSSSTAERICIDLRPTYLGRCYDAFWDRFGVAGSMGVVAASFTDLIESLATASSNEPFWSTDDFAALGDAYDPTER